MNPRRSLVVLLAVLFLATKSSAFEGRLHATMTQGSEISTFLYTVGPNHLRIERTETNWPHAKNMLNLDSGVVTLLFPHNRSFVRLKPASDPVASPFPGSPAMPVPPGGLPPGIGPQALVASPPSGLGAPTPQASIGPTNLPDLPAPPPRMQMPTMPNMPRPPVGLSGIGPQASAFPAAAGMPTPPMMPFPPMEQAELKATGNTTNLLGYVCARYELKGRGETMEIWATDKLLPFQPWRQNRSPHFDLHMIEDQWPELLKARKLFPLLATLRFENGMERFRFEVKSITPERIKDPEGKLFQPPLDYHEIAPPPF
jgi:hypothetical protein